MIPNFSKKVEVMRTIEYELSPPEYGLCRSCLASNFLIIRTMFLRSVYFFYNSLILCTDEMAREQLYVAKKLLGTLFIGA